MIEERLQKQVDRYSSVLDIIHGELKNMMYQAEEQTLLAQKSEDKSGEAMDSIERRYWEGYSDGLAAVYSLTYDLSFAIQERGGRG